MSLPDRWYERYFGADYLRIYRLADTAEQLQFLRDHLAAEAPGTRLLDLPCGHGRHAVEVASWGFRVTGLDLSTTFLDVARRAAAEHQVSLRLVRGDMRAFPFATASTDVAICLFNSLGYFAGAAENARVVHEFGRVVRPGGRLILDLANIDHVRHQPPSAFWEKDGAKVTTTYLWDEATHRAQTRRRVLFDDGREEHYESSVRLYEGPEIEALLAAAGFVIETRYGTWRGGDLTAATPRRILLCRRR